MRADLIWPGAPGSGDVVLCVFDRVVGAVAVVLGLSLAAADNVFVEPADPVQEWSCE